MDNNYSRYTEYAKTQPNLIAQLETLINQETSIQEYQNMMFLLGQALGKKIHCQLSYKHDINLCLASTVEDADYLSLGILEYFKSQNIFSIRFACFWNQEVKVDDLKATPIVMEYIEPLQPHLEKEEYLIIAKSCIRGTCVVRTNMEHLLNKYQFKDIFVVAPVVFHDAESKLNQTFNRNFSYIYFAKDNQKDLQDNVMPGIGGNVYQRLGFKDIVQKNMYMPSIVKQRRQNFLKQKDCV